MEFMDATNANLDLEIDCSFDSTAFFEKECKHHTYFLFFFYITKFIYYFVFFK